MATFFFLLGVFFSIFILMIIQLIRFYRNSKGTDASIKNLQDTIIHMQRDIETMVLNINNRIDNDVKNIYNTIDNEVNTRY